MWLLILSGCSLFCGLWQAPAASPAEVLTAEDLLGRMTLPARGHFLIETRTEEHPLGEEEFLVALELAREHQPTWFELARTIDASWVRARPHLFADDWVPLVLLRARPAFEEASQSESFECVDESFRWVSPGTAIGAAGQPLSAVQFRTRVGDELMVWNRVGSAWSATGRYPVVSSWGALRGAPFRFVDQCEQVRVLLEIAREQEGLAATPTRLEFRVDLRSPLLLERFVPNFPPAGLHQMPGEVVGRFDVRADGARLVVEWNCTSGALAGRDALTWVAASPYPSSHTREVFAPGTSARISSSSSSSIEVPQEAGPIRWEPRAGELVTDRRFAQDIHYHIGDDLALPEDAWLAEEAERSYLLENQESFDEYRFSRSAEAPVGAAEENPQAVRGGGSLVPVWDSIDLGTQPLRSAHPVRFELVNDGPLAITLGHPESPCTCLDVAMPVGRLEPGRAVVLTARQQVLGAGSSTTEIVVPYLEPGSGEPGSGEPGGRERRLRLTVRVAGVPAPLILPDPINLGRVSVGAPLIAALRVIGEGCFEPGEVPQARVPGYTLDQSWREGEDPHGRYWEGRLTLTPEETLPLGALDATVEVVGSACADVVGTALLIFERVPAGESDSWPSCRLVLSTAGAADAADAADAIGAEVRLPGTRIEGIRVEAGPGSLTLVAEVRPSDSGDVLVLRCTEPAHLMPAGQVVFELQTSRGRVRVKALVPRAPLTRVNRMVWGAGRPSSVSGSEEQ